MTDILRTTCLCLLCSKTRKPAPHKRLRTGGEDLKRQCEGGWIHVSCNGFSEACDTSSSHLHHQEAYTCR